MAKSIKSGLSKMVARTTGGGPVTPYSSPTTTFPKRKTVAKGKAKTKKMKGYK